MNQKDKNSKKDKFKQQNTKKNRLGKSPKKGNHILHSHKVIIQNKIFTLLLMKAQNREFNQ